MLKSFLFHAAPILQKIRKLAIFLAFIFVLLYVLTSVMAGVSDPQSDTQEFVKLFGPLIFGAVAISVVCELLHMMIKNGPVKIEASIFVEGNKLSEKQSMAVRMALTNYCEVHQTHDNDTGVIKNHSYNVSKATEVLKMINSRA